LTKVQNVHDMLPSCSNTNPQKYQNNLLLLKYHENYYTAVGYSNKIIYKTRWNMPNLLLYLATCSDIIM